MKKFIVQLLVITAINVIARLISESFTSGWFGGVIAMFVMDVVDKLWEKE